MSVVAVRHVLSAADRLPVAGRTVTAELVAPVPFLADHTGSIVMAARVLTDTTGLFELQLTPQLELAASGTHYVIRVAGTELEWHCVVPSSGPVQLANILVDPATLNPVAPEVASQFIPRVERGAPNGVAPLVNGTVPEEFLPAGGGGAVDSVNGQTGTVVLDAAAVGAPPTTRQVTAGTGLTGGGTLAADRSIALSTASITSLGKADTAVQPGGLAAVATSGAYADLTGKPSIPDSPDDIGAAPVAHTHPISDVTSLQSSLDGKAATIHAHTIANVTGLQAALDGKVPLSLIDAAGDLIVGSGADTLTRLAKGIDGQLLGIAAGALDWVDPPGSIDPVARRYGCKAITMHPHDLSAGALKFIAMANQRLYQYKVPIPAGELITGVRLPCKDAAAGGGQLHFAVYQEDLTQLGTTDNVAATFTGAVAQTWVNVPLTAADEATGDFVWIVALSTMDTGPQLAFCNTDNLGEFAWMLNPSGAATAVRTEGITVLPSTLSPEDETGYLDALLAVY